MNNFGKMVAAILIITAIVVALKGPVIDPAGTATVAYGELKFEQVVIEMTGMGHDRPAYKWSDCFKLARQGKTVEQIVNQLTGHNQPTEPDAYGVIGIQAAAG